MCFKILVFNILVWLNHFIKRMVSGEVLSVNPDTGLAFFICWNPSARPILAQMSLKSLDKFSDLKLEYLKPGVRVTCSLSRKAFGSDEIFEISDLEIVDVPITAFKAVPTSKASIVHKNKVTKTIRLKNLKLFNNYLIIFTC